MSYELGVSWLLLKKEKKLVMSKSGNLPNRTHNTASYIKHFHYLYFDGLIGRGNYRILRRDWQSTHLDKVVMNEKYSYGLCHICSCAISIPGLEAYYCSDCQKWLAYSNSKKNNFSSQTSPKTTQRKNSVFSPDQLTLTPGGES